LDIGFGNQCRGIKNIIRDGKIHIEHHGLIFCCSVDLFIGLKIRQQVLVTRFDDGLQ